jgi:hypothetical protein
MRLARFALVAVFAAVPLVAHNSSDPHADSYVLRLGDITYMNGRGMSGETLKELQSAYGKRFLWFRRGGRTYVVRTDDVLARAQAIIEPQAEVGRKQGTLGAKQGGLGQQQANLGARQAQIGQDQAHTRDSDGQAELDRQQRELSERQAELSKLQGDLSREQGKLSDMQERLSRQIEQQLGSLVDQCIRTGAAKEVGR